jgi:hypothetical protein
LKARFEQMQKEEPKLPSNRPVKVNRFVVSSLSVKSSLLFVLLLPLLT